MSPNVFALALFSRNAYFLPVGANLPPRLTPSLLTSDSEIGLLLLQNPTCAQHFDHSRLSILAQGHSPFHLSALEATYQTLNPSLCQQKEFMNNLKIVH